MFNFQEVFLKAACLSHSFIVDWVFKLSVILDHANCFSKLIYKSRNKFNENTRVIDMEIGQKYEISRRRI